MARVLSRLQDTGAKVVLIGNAEQLQPIETGAAFRAIADRARCQELTGICRQLELGQREASQDLARGEAARLERYNEHGAIRFAATRQPGQGGAYQRVGLITAPPKGARKSTLILAHIRADAA